MGYYESTCLNEKCKGPATLWTCSDSLSVECKRCKERIRFLELLARRADPTRVEPAPYPPVVVLVLPPTPPTVTYTQEHIDAWHNMKVPRSFIRTDEEIEAEQCRRKKK